MKRLPLLLAAVGLLAAAAAVARSVAPPDAPPDMQVTVEDRNPWTSLKLNKSPGQFQFVIVSDRTGGHRQGIFSKAVEQINLLQPEFVISVGDLIEGGPDTPESRVEQWKEFQTYASRLQCPFFYVPGNHDAITNTLAEAWDQRFGKRYYHFVYKDVLFLCLNACDGRPAKAANGRVRYAFGFSPEQIKYAEQALADNPDVRWTLVFLHAPVWAHKDVKTNGWLAIEEALKGRNYTVFCGHIHSYRKWVRNGMNYYQLATTGGGSRLRGSEFGEFDHVVWVTMKDDGPRLANLLLDSIYPEDLRVPVTAEGGNIPGLGVIVSKVRGRVALNGEPLTGAVITFTPLDEPEPGERVHPAAGAVREDGSFVLTTFSHGDGARPGRYRVTFDPPPRLIEGGDPPPTPAIPAKYRRGASQLEVEVKAEGENYFEFDLK